MEIENLNNEFLELYKEIEKLENDDPYRFSYFKDNYIDIENARHIRNIIAHTPDGIYVSNNFYKRILSIVNKMKYKVSDLYISLNKVKYVSLDTLIKDAINLMDIYNYSHIPVVDNGYLKGIISEKNIINLINKDLINKDKLVKDYLSYFVIKDNVDETYLNVSRYEFASDVKIKMSELSTVNKKCNLAIVSESGKENEKILGIITSWDLLEL